jgi:ABC-2 type transport system ATP-binding protein
MNHALELRGLTKTYPDFTLGPIDLDLEPGTVMGYIGPNGSGKTTTLHAVAGLVRRTGGEVRILDRIPCPGEAEWKHDIGLVSDENVFYEKWTAEKNLAFRSQFYPKWDHGLVARLAKELEVPMGKRAKELSGGNRTKLSLISALAHTPGLLLLDEPTSGLDPIVRSQVLDVLFSVVESGDRAILYSTHILTDISRLADSLTFLHEGRVLLTSATADLTERWRRISFRHAGPLSGLAGVREVQTEGERHRMVSPNHEQTVRQLADLGASDVQVTRMTLEEIAVQTLKGARDVAHHQG